MPGGIQEADAAGPSQELARGARQPVAADRAHVHRQLAHALRACSGASADVVCHSPLKESSTSQSALEAYGKLTPRGPRRNLCEVPVSQSQPIARTSTGSWPTLCAPALVRQLMLFVTPH